ncbi:MAG: T9SS type A sorting domain-containing protein, partial [candidate division Zixibacteria bacterium]|nr:T9SS type A sorting domain-containing protein [candidate division Zixibacteria bacterium]
DYSLPHQSNVNIIIFDILGKTVRTIEVGNQKAGYHSIKWDGSDAGNLPAASGIYFYQLIAGNFRQTRKMVLLR